MRIQHQTKYSIAFFIYLLKKNKNTTFPNWFWPIYREITSMANETMTLQRFSFMLINNYYINIIASIGVREC